MGLTRPTVGIVGGTGKMGSWFAGLLGQSGSKVFRVGRRTDLTPAQVAQQCDVVVISVPIADTVRVIQEVGPLVSENGVLMDLTSVKKGPVEAMLRYSRAEIVGEANRRLVALDRLFFERYNLPLRIEGHCLPWQGREGIGMA